MVVMISSDLRWNEMRNGVGGGLGQVRVDFVELGDAAVLRGVLWINDQ